MSRRRNVEAIDDAEGGITVTMRGKAAERFQSMADRQGMTAEELANKLLRDAIARGAL